MTENDVRACPHCGGEIKIAAKMCKHCKQQVPEYVPSAAPTPPIAPAPESPAPAVVDKPKLLTCEACEGPVSAAAKACPRCGHPGPAAEAQAPTSPASPPSRGSRTGLVIVGVVVAVVVIVVVVVVGNKSGGCGGDAPDGTWCDQSTGWLWQNPPDEESRTWDDANAFCDHLSLGGYSDWALPTIGELRTLIRNCPDTVSAGPCGVTDECLASKCLNKACKGCSDRRPAGGMFWDAALGGPVSHPKMTSVYAALKAPTNWFWSSSPLSRSDSKAWYVDFQFGEVGYIVRESRKMGGLYNEGPMGFGRTRCVRRPEQNP